MCARCLRNVDASSSIPEDDDSSMLEALMNESQYRSSFYMEVQVSRLKTMLVRHLGFLSLEQCYFWTRTPLFCLRWSLCLGLVRVHAFTSSSPFLFFVFMCIFVTHFLAGFVKATVLFYGLVFLVYETNCTYCVTRTKPRTKMCWGFVCARAVHVLAAVFVCFPRTDPWRTYSVGICLTHGYRPQRLYYQYLLTCAST